ARFRLVAVRGSERKIGPVRARLVDDSGNHWMSQQPRAIGFELGTRLAKLLDPVGIKERRSRSAVGEREAVAGGPAVVGQVCLQPIIGDAKLVEPLFRPVSISLAFWTQSVVDRRLHVSLNVEVEEAVEQSHLSSELSIRNPD